MNIESIHESWKPIIPLLFQETLTELRREILPNVSFQPDEKHIFRIFSMPVYQIKVVIIGLEPAILPSISNGLAFARKENFTMSTELKVIEKEVYTTKGIKVLNEENDIISTDWRTLQHWENQGIFLLNSALTVETGKPGSHQKYWNDFIKSVVTFISINNPCVWMLWGHKAQQYKYQIKNCFYVSEYTRELIKNIPSNPDFNYILQSSYPSGYETDQVQNFENSEHFFFVDTILKKTKSMQITW